MLITAASLEDHKALTQLTIESKSYWNYSAEQISKWIPELTISPRYIETKETFKLVEEGEIRGYYSFYLNDSQEIILDNLFVRLNSIGKGYGRALLFDFLDRVINTEYSRILVYSDPNSEGFYTHFGFEVIGQEPSSIKNRFLPILQKELR